MSNSNHDIGIITENENIIRRFQGISEQFEFQQISWKNIDDLLENPSTCKLYVFTQSDENISANDLSRILTEQTQTIKYEGGANAFVIAITKKMLPKDDIVFLRKSGLNYVIQENEVLSTSKLEFLTTQIVRTQYIAMKDADLIPDETITFDLYHLMTLRQKFLKIARSQTKLSSEKIKKMRSVSEFYIHRSELNTFKNYAKQGDLESHEGMLRQCRAQFLEFYATYTNLIAILTDQSETLSFEDGKKLLEDCQSLVSELANSLIKLGIDDVWEVVNNSAIGDFGSLERTTAIAAYVAFFSIRLNYGQLDNLILSALIAQIGIILLPPSITRKIRDSKLDDLNEEDLALYRSFPIKSLELVLNRRLPLDAEVKDIIMLCHERADGSGFPKGVKGGKLTKYSQLLGFCYLFDQATQLRMGDQRKSHDEVLKEVIERESQNANRFTPIFLIDLKKTFSQ